MCGGGGDFRGDGVDDHAKRVVDDRSCGHDGRDRETANLRGTTATLSASDYRLVTDDLELDETAFVLDATEKLQGLFTAG